jgi:cytochrome c oxidase assembly factor CtaG
VLTHLPAFYDAALRHPSIHYAEHALYVLAGLLMWSPLVDGDPAPRHRLSGLGRLLYLIVAMLPMALVGAYLNRHATLVYPAYGPPAHALGVSALEDQGQAGAIMWVVGSSVMVAVGLWAALAAMVAEERRMVARENRAGSLAAGDGGRTT